MHQKCAACSFRIARVVDMHLARRSLPVSRESRHQAKPDAEIGMWLCLVLIFAGDGERPECKVHVHGHARHFPARSVISDAPMTASLCVQVPRDTERPPGRPEFHLARVISAEDSGIVHVMYLRRCDIANTPLIGHRRSSNIFSRDRARARTGQSGGLGN